jgi:hypothetical protein
MPSFKELIKHAREKNLSIAIDNFLEETLYIHELVSHAKQVNKKFSGYR